MAEEEESPEIVLEDSDQESGDESEEELVSPQSEQEMEEEGEGGVLQQVAEALGIEEEKKKTRKPREKGEKRVRGGVRVPPNNSATFFKARRKDIHSFTYTTDGNLQVPEMKGEPARVIELPYYIPATFTEKEELDKQKQIELTRLDGEFDKKLKEYRDALEIWRLTGKASDVIKIQEELQIIDRSRTDTRSPLRWVKDYKSLEQREILVNEFYRTNKIGYLVSKLVNRGISFKDTVRATDKAPAPIEVKEEFDFEEAAEVQPSTDVIFFDPEDGDNFGILSPDFMNDFTFNSTQYNSLAQAYIVERLIKLGRQDLRKSILASRSPIKMRGLANLATKGKEIEDPLGLWVQIITAYVKEHDYLKEILQSAMGAHFIYASAKELSWGVGLELTDPEISNRTAWKGQNLVGKAWEIVRDSLPPEGAPEEVALPNQSGGALPNEQGKTEEEAKQQRKNVLQGYYRRRR